MTDRCDGERDCDDGSDEDNCSKSLMETYMSSKHNVCLVIVRRVIVGQTYSLPSKLYFPMTVLINTINGSPADMCLNSCSKNCRLF